MPMPMPMSFRDGWSSLNRAAVVVDVAADAVVDVASVKQTLGSLFGRHHQDRLRQSSI